MYRPTLSNGWAFVMTLLTLVAVLLGGWMIGRGDTAGWGVLLGSALLWGAWRWHRRWAPSPEAFDHADELGGYPGYLLRDPRFTSRREAML